MSKIWVNIESDPANLRLALDEFAKNNSELTTGWIQIDMFDYANKKATLVDGNIVLVNRLTQPPTR